MVQVGPADPANQTRTDPLETPNTEGSNAITRQPAESLLDRAKDNPLLPSLLLFGGLLLMVIILLRLLRKNARTRQLREHHNGTPAQRIAEIHQRAQSSMDPGTKLMVDAESVARRLSAQLDNKGARLELLLEEADRKLEMLNRQLASVDRQIPKPDSRPLDPGTLPEVRVPRTLDPSVLDRARIDQDLAERTNLAPSHTQPAPSPNSAQEQINDRILRLADDGLGCVEIARSLNQPIGQVELVLNLRKTS